MTEQHKALTEAQETLTLRLSKALADYLQSTAAIEWAELPEDWHPHMDVVVSVSTALTDLCRVQQG